MDETFISKCCREEVVEDDEHFTDDTKYICGRCKKRCEVEEVCAYCLGDGEVSTDETDSDGNVMRGVGTEKCVCRIDECDEDERE